MTSLSPSRAIDVVSPFAPRSNPPTAAGYSRRVALDIVGFLDVFGVIIGGIVPAWIFALYGGVAIYWPLISQTSLLAALFTYLCLRHFGLYDINRVENLPLSPLGIIAAIAIAVGIATSPDAIGRLDLTGC